MSLSLSLALSVSACVALASARHHHFIVLIIHFPLHLHTTTVSSSISHNHHTTGEKFKDNYAIDDLPKRVLHPWPAMQEFRWHVRMPTTHPMIPPPLLWLGLNDM